MSKLSESEGVITLNTLLKAREILNDASICGYREWVLSYDQFIYLSGYSPIYLIFEIENTTYYITNHPKLGNYYD